MPVITPCKKRKLTQQLGENKRPKQGNNRVWSITIGNSHTYTVYTLLLTVTGWCQPLRFTQSPPDPLPTSSLFFFSQHSTSPSVSLSLSLSQYINTHHHSPRFSIKNQNKQFQLLHISSLSHSHSATKQRKKNKKLL